MQIGLASKALTDTTHAHYFKEMSLVWIHDTNQYASKMSGHLAFGISSLIILIKLLRVSTLHLNYKSKMKRTLKTKLKKDQKL